MCIYHELSHLDRMVASHLISPAKAKPESKGEMIMSEYLSLSTALPDAGSSTPVAATRSTRNAMDGNGESQK